MIRPSLPECQPNEDGQTARPARRWTWRRLWPLAVVAAVVALVVASGVWRHVSLGELRDRRAALTQYVHLHPVLSLEIYAGAYAVLIALSLPGALVMSLAGGYLFGVVTGATAAVLGETVGATAMFVAARSTLGDVLHRRWGRSGGVLERMKAGAQKNAISTILMLRLIPGVPFTLVNLLAAMVRMPLAAYVLVTAAGITPSTVIYCGVGQSLVRVFKRSGAIDVHKLVTPDVYLPIVGLGVLAAAPLLWRMWKARHGDAGADGSATSAQPAE